MSRYLYLDSAGVIREGELPGASVAIAYAQEYRALTVDEGAGKFFSLSTIPVESSLLVQVSGVAQLEGVDYVVQLVGSEVQIQFIGDLAAGGISEVVAGDTVNVRYAIPPIDNSWEFQKATITLTPADVANQFFLLPPDSIANSETIIVGGSTLIRGIDYTLQTMGPDIRVLFAGTLATPGVDAVTVGDVFQAATARAL